MARATIEHALLASTLDAIFERMAEKGDTQELLFSAVVELMGAVVCGKAHRVQSAYQRMVDRIPVPARRCRGKTQPSETEGAAAWCITSRTGAARRPDVRRWGWRYVNGC